MQNRALQWWHRRGVRWGVALLLLPALLVNLHVPAFLDDEAIRGLVALEMLHSGNWITPTINGEYYYNKPPLYNWLLAVLYQLVSTPEEWISRATTVFFLLAFAYTIYHSFRPHYGSRIAWFSALAFITCGRVLFWESFLGLIDMGFSWAMFGLFVTVYRGLSRDRAGLLFPAAYLLASVGFLLKGLPALVFLGLTLLVGSALFGKWRRLLSPWHGAGMLLFAVLVGGYYYLYSRHHPLDQLWFRIFDESAKRTPLEFSWSDTLLHLLSFPLEVIYHFLPWTLLVLLFFRQEVRRKIRQHPFSRYLLLVFLVNLIPYWLSPEVYPRYLLMLMPLLFGPLFLAWQWHEEHRTRLWRFFLGLFLVLMLTILPALALPFFWDRLADIPARYVKGGFLALTLIPLVWAAGRTRRRRLWHVFAFLLLLRLGFNWFVLPDRRAHDWGHLCRQDAIRIARTYPTEKLYLYSHSPGGVLNDFHLTAIRGKTLRKHGADGLDTTALYLMDEYHARQFTHRQLDSMRVRYDSTVLKLISPTTNN